MRTSHCTIRPVVHSAGPEWAVYCDGAYVDQFPSLIEARRSALGSGDNSVYKTVLQVMSIGDIPVSTETITSTANSPGPAPGVRAGARA